MFRKLCADHFGIYISLTAKANRVLIISKSEWWVPRVDAAKSAESSGGDNARWVFRPEFTLAWIYAGVGVLNKHYQAPCSMKQPPDPLKKGCVEADAVSDTVGYLGYLFKYV